jgi:hypothetical protein
MQVDSIKPKLKPPESKRFETKCDEPLFLNAFKFNFRRYNEAILSSAESILRNGYRLACGGGDGDGRGVLSGFPSSHGFQQSFNNFGLDTHEQDEQEEVWGRGLHSFNSKLNLSRVGHNSACPPV